MTYEVLHDIVFQLKRYSLESRMRLFDLNPDRADVIVPAGEIFLNIMKWAAATKIFVPKIGLSDGMVREAYWEYKKGIPPREFKISIHLKELFFLLALCR